MPVDKKKQRRFRPKSVGGGSSQSDKKRSKIILVFMIVLVCSLVLTGIVMYGMQAKLQADSEYPVEFEGSFNLKHQANKYLYANTMWRHYFSVARQRMGKYPPVIVTFESKWFVKGKPYVRGSLNHEIFYHDGSVIVTAKMEMPDRKIVYENQPMKGRVPDKILRFESPEVTSQDAALLSAEADLMPKLLTRLALKRIMLGEADGVDLLPDLFPVIKDEVGMDFIFDDLMKEHDQDGKRIKGCLLSMLQLDGHPFDCLQAMKYIQRIENGVEEAQIQIEKLQKHSNADVQIAAYNILKKLKKKETIFND